MIKRTKYGNGLKEYMDQVQFIDTDNRSRNYFRLFDVPERLYVGKNAFYIAPNMELFVPGSKIYIDIYDATGNIIYHEIVKTVNLDKTRTILVYIYPDSQPGEARIYIAGRVRLNPYTGVGIPYGLDSSLASYRDVPNFMWMGNTHIVTTEQNNSELTFLTMPTVTYQEYLYAAPLPASASRYTASYNTTQTVSIKSIPNPYQYSNYGTSFSDANYQSGKILQKVPIVSLGVIGTTQDLVNISEHGQLTIVKTNTSYFTKDMVGGYFFVNDIDMSGFIPGDASSSGEFNSVAYTGSIVRVINDTTAELDRPFLYTQQYTRSDLTRGTVTFNQFISAPTFRCVYFKDSISVELTETADTAIRLDFTGLEPLVGTVDYIRVHYKEMNRPGEFVEAGKYAITGKNYLVTDGTFVFGNEEGIQFMPLGYFAIGEQYGDITTNWATRFNTSESIETITKFGSSANIQNAMAVRWTGPGPRLPEDYVAVYLRQFFPTLTRGTEYKLKFSTCFVTGSAAMWNKPTMDVYISGSQFMTDTRKRANIVTPITNVDFGEYLGTLETNGRAGSKFDAEYYFIVKETAPITPVFVMRNGKWDIGKIEITPRKDIGYSPNQFYAIIPITDKIRSTELMIKVEYYNNEGIKSKYDSMLYGVYFSGSLQLPSGSKS